VSFEFEVLTGVSLHDTIGRHNLTGRSRFTWQRASTFPAKATAPLCSASGAAYLEAALEVGSLWSGAFRRFRQDPGAVIGLGLVFCMVRLALAAPLIATHDPIQQDLGNGQGGV
jgi:hypothetical protein